MPENTSLIEPPAPLDIPAVSPPEARGSATKDAEHPHPQEIKVPSSPHEFLWKTHSYINEYIRFSDTKAGFVITLSGALLGALFSTKAHELFIKSEVSRWSWLSWCSCASFLTSAMAVLLGIVAIRPRLWSHTDHAFIYWGGIAKHTSMEAFTREYKQLPDDCLLEHLVHHVFELSTVCARKYFWVSASILAGGLGGLLAAVVVLFHSAS
jgi:hypothetical protein